MDSIIAKFHYTRDSYILLSSTYYSVIPSNGGLLPQAIIIHTIRNFTLNHKVHSILVEIGVKIYALYEDGLDIFGPSGHGEEINTTELRFATVTTKKLLNKLMQAMRILYKHIGMIQSSQTLIDRRFIED